MAKLVVMPLFVGHSGDPVWLCLLAITGSLGDDAVPQASMLCTGNIFGNTVRVIWQCAITCINQALGQSSLLNQKVQYSLILRIGRQGRFAPLHTSCCTGHDICMVMHIHSRVPKTLSAPRCGIPGGAER